MTRHVPVAVLGGGISGLAAGLTLQKTGSSYCIFEKRATPGGIAGSYTVESFTFDFGIHGLYTKSTQVERLLAGAVGNTHQLQEISIVDYWDGHWIRHPVHFHLRDLPTPLASNFLIDFLEASVGDRPGSASDFSDWCVGNLGPQVCDSLVFPYIRKFWTVEPSELTSNWMGQRTKVPSIAEIVRGALLDDPPNTHYVQRILYPQQGGFGSYANGLAATLDIEYEKEVVSIDSGGRTIRFLDGSDISYDHLISTFPLPVLIGLLEGAPVSVVEAAATLQATSLALVSLGIARESVLDHHWVYVHDTDIPFARLSTPSLWARSNAPTGTSSLQAEIYFRGKEPSADALIEETATGLRKMNLLRASDQILVQDFRTLPFANVIHDHHRESALRGIRDYLRQENIVPCGRYGVWDYSLVDEVILETQRITSPLAVQSPRRTQDSKD